MTLPSRFLRTTLAARGERDSKTTPPSRRFHQTTQVLAWNALLLFFISSVGSPLYAADATKLWDLDRLSSPPSVVWGETKGLVQEVFYEGEPFNDKPTQVFGYVGRPATGTSPYPAMVLVHGGGGKAFVDWAQHWAKRGYVALAMDLAGKGPEGRLDNGGPDQSDAAKFKDFTDQDIRNMWSYHAVAAVVRGNSLLRSLPEVDDERVGLTGISWGGYLTCIVAGIDSRFQVAVPVYGCGFLGENSYWKDRSLAALSPESRVLWLTKFDPSNYLSGIRCPVLFVNGTTDFAYPLDSYKKSYALVEPKWRHISVEVNRAHGHYWHFPEVDGFVDSILRESRSFVRITPPVIKEGTLSSKLNRVVSPKEALLCFTKDQGPWDKRTWETRPAQVTAQTLHAILPEDRPLVAFLALKDEEGWHVSSEHIELE